MNLGKVWRLAIGVALGLRGLTGSVQARTNTADEPATSLGSTVTTVQFEGRQIDLTGDWGAAHACVIWEQASASACFRTEAELDQHVAAVEAVSAADPTTPAQAAAAGWSNRLRVLENNALWRRVPQFRDR